MARTQIRPTNKISKKLTKRAYRKVEKKKCCLKEQNMIELQLNGNVDKIKFNPDNKKLKAMKMNKSRETRTKANTQSDRPLKKRVADGDRPKNLTQTFAPLKIPTRLLLSRSGSTRYPLALG